jgi:hypothetical protein
LVVSSTYFSSSFVSQKISWHRLLLFQFKLFLLTDKLTRSTARWQHSTCWQNWLQRVVIKNSVLELAKNRLSWGVQLLKHFFSPCINELAYVWICQFWNIDFSKNSKAKR